MKPKWLRQGKEEYDHTHETASLLYHKKRNGCGSVTDIFVVFPRWHIEILPRFRPKPWNVLLETLEGFHEMLLNNRVIVAELPGHFCWFFWDSPQKHPCALKRKMLRLCGRLEPGIRNLRDFTQ